MVSLAVPTTRSVDNPLGFNFGSKDGKPDTPVIRFKDKDSGISGAVSYDKELNIATVTATKTGRGLIGVFTNNHTVQFEFDPKASIKDSAGKLVGIGAWKPMQDPGKDFGDLLNLQVQKDGTVYGEIATFDDNDIDNNVRIFLDKAYAQKAPAEKMLPGARLNVISDVDGPLLRINESPSQKYADDDAVSIRDSQGKLHRPVVKEDQAPLKELLAIVDGKKADPYGKRFLDLLQKGRDRDDQGQGRLAMTLQNALSDKKIASSKSESKKFDPALVIESERAKAAAELIRPAIAPSAQQKVMAAIFGKDSPQAKAQPQWYNSMTRETRTQSIG